MKSFLIIFITFFLGCSPAANNSRALELANKNSPEISNRVETANLPSVALTPEVSPANNKSAQISKNTNCEGYRLETSKEDGFNLINIFDTDQGSTVIKLPTGITVNGFALNYVKKSKNGFLFSVEYGSRYYYEKEFNFVCQQGEFYLTSILVHTHDQADPEKSAKKFTIQVTPKVRLDQFEIAKYMTE